MRLPHKSFGGEGGSILMRHPHKVSTFGKIFVGDASYQNLLRQPYKKLYFGAEGDTRRTAVSAIKTKNANLACIFNYFCQFGRSVWSFFRLNGISRVLERSLQEMK